MRTHSKEKNKVRGRMLSAMRGHLFEDYNEFLPVDVGSPNAPPYGKIFKRDEWGAKPRRRSDGRLSLPIMYVNTVSVFMGDDDGEIKEAVKGPEAVRWFQSEDMDNGMSDIRSNFIIDEDGMIYEGRGWDQKPAITKPDSPSKFMEYLEICYIGDFSGKELNHPAHFATAKLMEMGKQRRILSRDALILSPEGVFYERKGLPKTQGYLPVD